MVRLESAGQQLIARCLLFLVVWMPLPALASGDLVGCYSLDGPTGGLAVTIRAQGSSYVADVPALSEKGLKLGPSDPKGMRKMLVEDVAYQFKIPKPVVRLDAIAERYIFAIVETPIDSKAGKTRYVMWGWAAGPGLLFRIQCRS
jgi:hypothetical protein